MSLFTLRRRSFLWRKIESLAALLSLLTLLLLPLKDYDDDDDQVRGDGPSRGDLLRADGDHSWRCPEETPRDAPSGSGAPAFDLYHVENYTVQQGATAFLPCVIKNLGNESVSWIRQNDSHILTVDEDKFVSDPRISTIHETGKTDTWMLQIKSVSLSDDGKYECQVSTVPKLSKFVHLVVRVPRVHIFGDQDIYVKSASAVQMKCVVSQSLEPPNYFEWRHDGKRLQLGRGGSSRIQATPPEHIAEGTTISTLSILRIEPFDQGDYTCQPALMDSATATLHVVDTDLPAAMQTSGGGSSRDVHKS